MKNIFYYLIIFILVNTGGGIYIKFARNELTILLFILLILYLVLLQKEIKKTTFSKAILVFLILIFLLVFNFLVAIPGQSLNTYTYMSITLIIVFMVNLTIDYQDFLDKFYKVLIFIEIQAFFTFFAYFFIKGNLTVIPGDPGDLQVYTTFHYIFFYLEHTIRSFGSFTIIRNQGVFWEPGILQLFLNVTLFIQLFYKQVSFPKIAFTIFLIFTTFSTTGLLVMIIVLVYKFKSLLTMKNFFVVLPIALLVVSAVLPFVIDNIVDKTSGEHATSGYVRFFDFLQGIFIVKDYPFTGIGLSIDPMWELQQKFYKTILGFTIGDPTGSTNSIVTNFVVFGIPLALLYFYGLYRQTIFTKNKGLFFLIILMTFMSEPIGLRGIFIFLVMNGLMDIIGTLVPTKQKTQINLYPSTK